MPSTPLKNRTDRFIEKAYRAFFTPGQYESAPEALAILEHGRTRLLNWAGGELPLTTWGEGAQSVLLVHGWGGARSQMTGFVQPLLAAGFRVVAFDQPGHGDSGGRTTNILEISSAMESVADAEGPFHAVVAHSFGTLVTSYALTHCRYPRPARLVYLGAFNRLLDSLPRFQALSGLPDPVIAGIETKIHAEFGPGVLDAIVNAELVREIPVPAMMFHDTEDEVTPVDDSRAISAAWPHAEYFETLGLKHHGALQSGAIIDDIVGFLKRK